MEFDKNPVVDNQAIVLEHSSELSSDLSNKPDLRVVKGEYNFDPSVIESLLTERFDYNRVADVIADAIAAHREISISMGQSPAGAYEGRSAVYPLTANSDLKGAIIGEFRGDGRSLELMQQELKKLEGVEIDRLIIMAENSNPSLENKPYEASSALDEVAERLDIRISHSVKNLSQWTTVEKAAELSEVHPPPLPESQIAAFYIMQGAAQADNRLRFDLLTGVDRISKSWGQDLSLEKLYTAAYYQMDVAREKQGVFRELTNVIGLGDQGPVSSFDRASVERMIAIGEQTEPVLSRWEIIGGLTLLASPVDPEQGFPNYYLAMNRCRDRWENQIPFADLHRGVAYLRRFQEHAPIEFQDRIGRIASLAVRAQNLLTTDATLEALKRHPDKNAVIVLCGHYRVESVQKAFQRYSEC